MADGIVSTILFVLRIVAARSVGTRKDQRQLLHVHRPARDAEIHSADYDDAAAIPRNTGRQFDRLSGRTCSRNNCDISSVAGKFLDSRRRIAVRGTQRQIRAKLPGAFDSLKIAVNGDHTTACRSCQLNREHANESCADHCHDLAQHRLTLTETLERDGPDRAQRGRLQRDSIRNSHRKIFRNEIDFTMAGVACAGAGDPIAGLKFRHARACGDHNSSAAISRGTSASKRDCTF